MAVAMRVKKWTLAEVHRLPDDGNKYELVRGELFVTPPPGEEHETILAKLSALLTPYVQKHELGLVYHPRAVVRYDKSEVEPDLMVRQPHPRRRDNDKDWNTAPIPILVVEVLSPYTRRRDFNQKKGLYLDAGVAEYWIVDAESRTITIAKPGQSLRIEGEQMTWAPRGADRPLTFEIAVIF
ncbi:MAG TPA: Uma2 family endonuclease [Gemmatimonadaceae bacterium]|jgi:Uma2 family endonuclease